MATIATPLRHISRQFICCCCCSSYVPAFMPREYRRIFSSSVFAFLPLVSSPPRRLIRIEGRAPYADSAFLEEDSDFAADNDTKKSRNQKKREARRAVQWGMDLAKFSPQQIKLILGVASFDNEVYDAVMLAKRLGSDVREGRRRQFSYIGKLLRNAEPELMDEMIRAMKDGDLSRIQVLSARESIPLDDVVDVEEEAEDNMEEDDDMDRGIIETAGIWFEGLINKDVSVVNEVYSINGAAFDRQELRRLVRRVQSLQEQEERSEQMELTKAKTALSRFLIQLAQQSVVE